MTSGNINFKLKSANESTKLMSKIKPLHCSFLLRKRHFHVKDSDPFVTLLRSHSISNYNYKLANEQREIFSWTHDEMNVESLKTRTWHVISCVRVMRFSCVGNQFDANIEQRYHHSKNLNIFAFKENYRTLNVKPLVWNSISVKLYSSVSM